MRFLFIAINAIKNNKLRAGLTITIIALGIMALVGMVTALNSIQLQLRANFAELGSNTFKITKKGNEAQYGERGSEREVAERIQYRQADFFKNNYRYPARVAIHYDVSSQAIVQYRNEKTNPQIAVKGIDDHFLYTSGQNIAKGRNFTEAEIRSGSNVAILGKTLKLDLFGYKQALGERITVGGNNYRVVGILQKKGSSMSFSGDNAVLIPYNSARMAFNADEPDFEISVKVGRVDKLDRAVQEAIGIFRVARGLNTRENNDFKVNKSDNLADRVKNNLWYVRIATFLIGFITLLGATVGLMNIMLVSVKERTGEIGIRKALGASSAAIRSQFFGEAIVISQIGGILGIVFGITVGNGVALLLNNQFTIPWFWVVIGFVICLLVGILAGYYPARQAAKLDPINALRYE